MTMASGHKAAQVMGVLMAAMSGKLGCSCVVCDETKAAIKRHPLMVAGAKLGEDILCDEELPKLCADLLYHSLRGEAEA